MAMEGDKWRVVRGDCLWNIAKSVYGDPYRWRDIANANGISQKTALIYPGNLLTLPGRTSTASSPAPAPNYSRKVTIQWFALDSGTDRSMFITWSYDRPDTKDYEVLWEYDTGAGGWRIASRTNVTDKQANYNFDASAKKMKVTITPKSEKWTDGAGEVREYNFANNPPELPPSPSFSIDTNNKLEATIANIQETINADTIEFAIYQDDVLKYKTINGSINLEARFVKIVTDVDPGHSYKIRCRGIRGSIYGGYTDFTDSEKSLPIAPKSITTLRSEAISQQQSTAYAVFVEWEEQSTAEYYRVEWATNIEWFGTDQASSQDTEPGKGPRLLIPGIDKGYRYYFRVASVNDKGISKDYTPIKDVTLGTKPQPPTTYSNVVSCVTGEDLNLYWVHNSTDGSYESYARLQLTITDSARPELEPMVIIKTIKNDRPEEEKGKTQVYTINTNDPEWATLGQGYVIKWKVQTAGVTSEYSEFSTERQAIIYTKPALSIDILNNQHISVDEINTFPFYISVLATPPSQTPISYYVEILSDTAYQTVDDVGKIKMVNVGDIIYQKYYDPQINPWQFMLEMSPENLDLENNASYTINVTVSMDSGLTALNTKKFTVYFEDLYYDVYADVLIDKETVSASIHPYCSEIIDGVTKLVENCTLSIFRRGYDGTFVEIATGISNEPNLYITDPHPALDYARYRIVAKMNDTGAISFGDIKAVPVNIKAAIIQWSEEWSSFEVSENGDGVVEPAWSGSMLKLPYNITVSDSKAIDVSLVKYAGRENPVSYYGTHIGETSSWSMVVPKEDKETLYAIRRLSRFTGDVYAREPYGTGYWANISVSYNLKYSDLIVPVTISLTRVEGGM